MSRYARTALLVLGVCGWLSSPALATDDEFAPRADPQIKDWYQRRGNSARSGVSTCRPVRHPPELAWRVNLPGKVVSNVVSWSGVVFVAIEDRRGQVSIRAFSVQDGGKRGARKLKQEDSVELAVLDGVVVAQQDRMLSFHTHKGSQFRLPVEWEGSFSGWPLVHAGKVYAILGSSLVQKKLGSRDGYARVGECQGGASYQLVGGTGRLIRGWLGSHPTYQGDFLFIAQGRGRPVEYPARRRSLEGAPELCLHRFGKAGARGGWLLIGEVGILSAKNESLHGVYLPDFQKSFYSHDLLSEAVVRGNEAVGWTGEGTLILVTPDGTRELMGQAGRPEGFAGRELSAARDVLYVGNSAVELASGRVLWSLAGLEPASPLLPVADGRIVALTWDGDLVCFAEPKRAGAASAPEAASAKPAAAPASGDGVLLADGSQVLGKVTLLDDGRVRVAPEKGDPREFGPQEVAAAISDGSAVGPREEFLCYRTWRTALRAEAARAYADLVLRCTSERLLTEARRILERARSFGLPSAEVGRLGTRLSGLSENPNAAAKGARVRGEEKALRKELAARFTEGVDWLEARGLKRAAAALLSDVSELAPRDPAWRTRGAALAPAAFPFRESSGAGRLWVAWAKALLPSGAEFLPDDAPERRRVRHAPWTDALALRSKNLLLLSRSEDPTVVSDCLQRGETAVRALEKLLYEEGAPQDEEPLAVLLHRNREEYLAEKSPVGGAPKWSAGYYSPLEKVSRFFVPTNETSGDPLGRSLYSTLAHELTHHWVHLRWVRNRGSRATTPGYWIVEGIAQYVGDQAADSDPHTVRLDNPSVPSLDAMAQAAAAGKSLPMPQFVDLSHVEFAQLGGRRLVTVRLRNTLVERPLTERALFYEQSAALTWFLMNRRGPEGRERVRRYLWAHYQDESPRGGWAALGFESSEQLARELEAFLTELAGKPARLQRGRSIAAGPSELPPAKPPKPRNPAETAGPTGTRRGGDGGTAGGGPTGGGDEDGEKEDDWGPKLAFDIGDKVWIHYGDKHYAGSVTGWIDGKFWVTFGYQGKVARLLVTEDKLRPR